MDLRIRGGGRSQLIVLCLLFVLAGCSAQTPVMPTPRGAIPDWRVDLAEPYPFGASPPPLTPTPIDGSYSREPTDLTGLTRIGCVRCQPYPLDRGESVLTLDAGRWRMQHEAPPYRARGHYKVQRDVLTLFNDAECGHETGSYRWRIADGRLTLEVLDDTCAFGQRDRDLTDRTWQADEDRKALAARHSGFSQAPVSRRKRRRNCCVSSSCGASRTCSGGPSSTMRPSSR